MVRPKIRFFKEIPYKAVSYKDQFLIRNLPYKNGYKSDSTCHGHGVLLEGASSMNHSLIRITENCAPCGRVVSEISVYGIAQNCGPSSVAISYGNFRSTECCKIFINLLSSLPLRNGILDTLNF